MVQKLTLNAIVRSVNQLLWVRNVMVLIFLAIHFDINYYYSLCDLRGMALPLVVALQQLRLHSQLGTTLTETGLAVTAAVDAAVVCTFVHVRFLLVWVMG